MARLNIEDKWWTDPRRSKLMKLLGGEDEADLAAIRLWKLAQGFWGKGRNRIPFDIFELLEAAPKLIEAKLAFVEDGYVYAKGSVEYLSWLNEKRESAAKGGKRSAESRKAKSGSAQPSGKKDSKASKQTRSTSEAKGSNVEPSFSFSYSSSISNSSSDSDSDECEGLKEPPSLSALDPSPTSRVWQAYKLAFRNRYGVNPTWNAKVGGQLKHFVSRVPSSESAQIAAFYLSHNGARYVSSGHSLGNMLTDAEKLRMEWETGRRVTSIDSRHAEVGDALQNQLRRLSEHK